MSPQQVRVASLLLGETFGQLVERVGTHLIRHGALPMVDIVRGTGMKQVEVKRSLCVLLQHHLVTCLPHKRGSQLYQPALTSILQLARFPRFIQLARELLGNAGELIVEDILRHGQSPMSQCLERVMVRIKQGAEVEQEIKDKFRRLVEEHFLQRVVPCSSANATPPASMTAEERFQLPPNLDSLPIGKKRSRSPDAAEPEPKRTKRTKRKKEMETPGADIFWYINSERFHQHLRRQAVANAVSEKLDTTASNIMSQIISLSQIQPDTTGSASAKGAQVLTMQISEALPESIKLSLPELEQHLSLLAEEQFLHKEGDSSRDAFRVNHKKISEIMAQACIESVVKERYGSKPFRVFRLLMMKKLLEQKQISEMALIPQKEAKEMLYSLLAENFVSVQEIPRTADYAPSRTFYLFSVNLQQVARTVLSRCYKALGNLMARRKHESTVKKRLLDKYQVWERQQQQPTDNEGMEDAQDGLTPAEKESAERAKHRITKLGQGELQVDTTIMILEDFISCH